MEFIVLNISWNRSHVSSDIPFCREALFSVKYLAGL